MAKLAVYASSLQGRFLYFVCGSSCYRLTSHDGENVQAFNVEALQSTQEEADTRIILHCLHVKDTEAENTKIVVRSPDTDVLVLLCKYMHHINRQVFFDTGVGNKRRLLCVSEIASQVGETFCSILPALHCLTGCDTTSAFVRRGKLSPLKLVKKKPDYADVLAQLGEQHECSNELVDGVEQFVCAMYGSPMSADINKLRFDIFCKKNQGSGNILDSSNSIDMILLPPCKSSLKMHVLRVNYQTYIWNHANEKDPKLPDKERSGWRIGSDGVEIVWTEAAIVPQQLVDILCEKETSDSSVEDDIEDDVEMENFIDEVYDDESDNDEV